MTAQDVAVQVGAMMAAAGGMLAAWGLFSGQLHRPRPRSRSRRADR